MTDISKPPSANGQTAEERKIEIAMLQLASAAFDTWNGNRDTASLMAIGTCHIDMTFDGKPSARMEFTPNRGSAIETCGSGTTVREAIDVAVAALQKRVRNA